MFNKKNVRALKQIRLSAIFTLAIMIAATIAVVQVQAMNSVFESVDVDSVYNMITSDNPDLVILDVRPLGDYTIGHLYNAISMPYSELPTRIGELQEFKGHEMIVYCRTGVTSQMACEFLVEKGFSKVFNMVGGILAWIDADYPISTTFHHVIVEPGFSLQVEPLLLLLTNGCSSCGQNPPSSGNTPVQTSTLVENETHTIVEIAYEMDDIAFQIITTTALLWSMDIPSSDGSSRSISFTSTWVTGQDVSIFYYSATYKVWNDEYNLTIDTKLLPISSGEYNRSFTDILLVPNDGSEVNSLEFFECDKAVRFSKLYDLLCRAARTLGQAYESAGEDQLAQNYYVMRNEAKFMSEITKECLGEYDQEILHSSAILADYDFWACLLVCNLPCNLACLAGCGGLCLAFPPACAFLSECGLVVCNVFCGMVCDATYPPCQYP
jgi:rhodanese-related sulfurtransferase